jgi:hypothetical protein
MPTKFILMNGSVVIFERADKTHVYVTDEGRGLPKLSLYIPKEYVRKEIKAKTQEN